MKLFRCGTCDKILEERYVSKHPASKITWLDATEHEERINKVKEIEGKGNEEKLEEEKKKRLESYRADLEDMDKDEIDDLLESLRAEIHELRKKLNPETDEDKQLEKTLPTRNDEIKVNAVLARSTFTPTKEFSTKIFTSVGIKPAQLVNILKNPFGFGRGLIGRFVLPIAGVAIGIEIAKMAWEWMTGPGGPFDKRVKIIAKNEAFAMLDRQTRQNTRIGDREVIIQTFQGFRNFGGFASTSTGELIRQNADRVLDIGLFDRAQDVMLGGK